MDNYSKVKNVFESDVKDKAISIYEYEDHIFNNNRVYRVDTKEKSYIFKSYKSADYPENGKINFVSNKLSENNVPHARILVNNYNSDFPNGYIIEDSLPGITAEKLDLTIKETCLLYEKLAKLILKIHSIKLINYGFIVNCEPDSKSFTKHINKEFIYGKHNIADAYSYYELRKLKSTLISELSPLNDIQPCLCHMDIQLKNVIVYNENLTLIDWDDARSFPAVTDLARFTLLIELAFDDENPEDPERIKLFKQAFLDSYYSDGGIDLYLKFEALLHLWHGLVILNFCNPGTPQFFKTKKIVDEKIKLL